MEKENPIRVNPLFPAVECPQEYFNRQKEISITDDNIKINNDMKIVRTEKYGERFDVCYTTALTNILGITGQAPEKLKISRGSDLIEHCNILEKYFEQKETPTTGCIVAYAFSNNHTNHFGVVTKISPDNIPTECIVESKFGLKAYIIEHKLFDIPTGGNNAYFYALKDEYAKDKNLLLKRIQTDIAQSDAIKKTIHNDKIMLLKLANGTDVKHPATIGFDNQDNLIDKAWYLLKASMGLPVNTFNMRNQTVLMLAAKRNDSKMVDAFISFGADLNKKDKDGNTALMLTSTHKCYQSMAVLLMYNADATIANNNGDLPQIPENIKELVRRTNNILLSIALEHKIETGDNDFDSKSSYEKALHYLTNARSTININAQEENFSCLTPLMVAILKNNTQLAQLLIEHGADVALKDSNGHTALDMSIGLKNDTIADLIRSQSNK
jgi:ankyrin repeat protein